MIQTLKVGRLHRELSTSQVNPVATPEFTPLIASEGGDDSMLYSGSGPLAFSVLISVYKNDDPQFFDQAIESVTLAQTLPPDEVVLVVDGPVSDSLNSVINKWERQTITKFKVVRSAENMGLSRALNLGLNQCGFDFVARMDSDDISVPTRFETQIRHLEDNRDLALLGGWYEQYDQHLQRYLTDRKVPESMDEILGYAKSRTPFNHVTAVLNKNAVMAVGGYPDIHGYHEDWWLALRLLKQGFQLANLPEYLVKVRGDRDFIGRRGGLKFLQTEIANLTAMHRQQLIGKRDLMKNLVIRGLVRLLPASGRTWIYQAIRRF